MGFDRVCIVEFMSTLQVSVALLVAVASAETPDGYRTVPGSGGAMFHESCIKEAPNGVVVDDSFDLSCDQPLLWPNEQVYAMDAHTNGSVAFTQMNSSFIVPDLPLHGSSGTVFLWPGFKAQKPQPGYPVLQYAQRPWQLYWEMQSWFV